jgi:hypothetical protein
VLGILLLTLALDNQISSTFSLSASMSTDGAEFKKFIDLTNGYWGAIDSDNEPDTRIEATAVFSDDAASCMPSMRLLVFRYHKVRRDETRQGEGQCASSSCST